MKKHKHIPKHILLREKKLVDRLMLAMGIIGPLSSLPQILIIYSTRSAGNVSLASWVMYLGGSLIGLTYALIHNLRVLQVGYALYLVVNASVVVGTVLY